jgi:hypothetical protein
MICERRRILGYFRGRGEMQHVAVLLGQTRALKMEADYSGVLWSALECSKIGIRILFDDVGTLILVPKK